MNINQNDGSGRGGYKPIGTLISLNNGKGANNQFVPLWQQQATDEKGRKRFHGAFKGGFSAGYFNTVGSKEGFEPKTFQSSRGNKAEMSQQKVEDFMDEEDLEDLKNYQTLTAKPQLDNYLPPSLAGTTSNTGFLGDLLTPIPKNQIGLTILRQQGWNTDLNADKLEGSNELKPIPKTDLKGLQIQCKVIPVKCEIQKNINQVIVKESNTNKREFNQQPKVDKIQSLDFEQFKDPFDSDEDKVVLSRKKRRPPPPTTNSNISTNTNTNINTNININTTTLPIINNTIIPSNHIPNVISRALGHDGLPPLSSFVLAAEPFIISIEELNDISSDLDLNVDFSLGDPFQFSKVNDQEPKKEIELNKRSVMDFLSQKDKDRILLAKTNPIKFKTTSQPIKPIIHSNLPDMELLKKYATINSNIAQLALKGYQPFVTHHDSTKQVRYHSFLNFFIKDSQIDWPKKYIQEDKINEIREFDKVAKMFQPMSNMMSDRFVSSSSLKSEIKVKPKDPLQRTYSNFYPTSLLIKRFNVTYQPTFEAKAANPNLLQNGPSKLNFQKNTTNSNTQVLDLNKVKKDWDLIEQIKNDNNNNINNNNDDNNNNEDDKRPDKKLFETIFNDDSDDDDDDF